VVSLSSITLRFQEFLLAVRILRGVGAQRKLRKQIAEDVSENAVQQESTPPSTAGDTFITYSVSMRAAGKVIVSVLRLPNDLISEIRFRVEVLQ
jgi:hypothetical protein